MKEDKIKPKKYVSRYSPGKLVTGAALIIEVVCENSAKKENKELPTFFWTLPAWEKFFKSQLRACHNLIKKHSQEKVLEFVRIKRIYNLRFKEIDEWLVEFKYEPKKVKKSTLIIVEKPTVTKTRKIKGLGDL